MHIHPLDVCLNQDRNYVQGTQILSRTADALRESGSITLRQALFSRISIKRVAMSDAAQDSESTVGRGVFETAQGASINVFWTELDEDAPREVRLTSGEFTQVQTWQDAPLSGKFNVSGVKTGEDLMNVIIQAIKSRHQALASDVKDVWFTGIRRSGVPFGPLSFDAGTLMIHQDRIAGTDGAFQTLQRVTFDAETGDQVDAVITFSFKSQVYDNAY